MAKSAAFAADLPPDMTAEQLAKLYNWGKTYCCKFDVQLMDNGAMLLVAVRKKPGTARDHMRLLRTNLLHWKVEMPPKQANWLRLIDEAESARSESAPQESAPSPEREEPTDDLQQALIGPTFTTRSCQPELPKNLLTHPERFVELAAAHAAQLTVH